MEAKTVIRLFAGGLLTVGGGAAMKIGPEIYPDLRQAFFRAGIAFAALGIVFMCATLFGKKAETGRAAGNTVNQNVTSHDQSGGITAHTVNKGADDVRE